MVSSNTWTTSVALCESEHPSNTIFPYTCPTPGGMGVESCPSSPVPHSHITAPLTSFSLFPREILGALLLLPAAGLRVWRQIWVHLHPEAKELQTHQLPNQNQKLCQHSTVLDAAGLLMLRSNYSVSCDMVLTAIGFPGPSWNSSVRQSSSFGNLTDGHTLMFPNGNSKFRLFFLSGLEWSEVPAPVEVAELKEGKPGQ